jgi:hypothetical protein
MTRYSTIALYWAPRALSILFILFISMFALDVFGTGRGFWQTLVAFLIHLIPTYILIGTLVVAWRREWVGSVVFTFLGVLFLWWNSRQMTWFHVVFLAGPLFITAGLFLLNWLKRDELHANG